MSTTQCPLRRRANLRFAEAFARFQSINRPRGYYLVNLCHEPDGFFERDDDCAPCSQLTQDPGDQPPRLKTPLTTHYALLHRMQ